ncbi:methyltransferase domain-containing protein [Pantoea coffeiphila]|uniref:methyltransferase domain-containing protein n=1 Tax=Pantoea coffeiphila TaxID=1465635 RepID=UPI00195F2C1F|nr:methyltransferase domain-containing protein [Pantoea coffeiphila]MBM7341526.1 2-polyprenyl-3-methyl-5-hydroxy-6-metoxy-1,4-benzoquinol methylase [Pantoea coffeiphila]
MTFPVRMIDRLAADSVLADSVQLALQNNLFDHLQNPLSARQLAEKLQWHADPTAHLLELLWSFQLLDRQQQQGESLLYRTASAVIPYLCQQGERYMGDAWRYRLQALRGFGQQLTEMLKQPLPEYSEQLPHDAAWAAAAGGQIAQEQRALTADTACAIAATVTRFNHPARMLDMGGGPGLVSVALAQRYPQLTGVVQDLPLTAEVAQGNLVAAGVGDRFSAVSELADSDRFDIIWCSSFLHFVADPAQTLADLYRRLNPGGVLISAHARLGDDPQQVSRVLPFFLPLLMRGKHVFHHHQLTQMLTEAGFRVEDRGEQPFPMAPLHIHCAWRGERS